MIRPRFAAVLLLVLGLFESFSGLSCKEGDPLTRPLVAQPDFTAAAVDAGITSHYVSMRKGSVNESRITLEIVVTNVTEQVSGIAAKLTYPRAIARFVSTGSSGCTDGDLFPEHDPCYFSEPAPGSGEVFIGRSIVAPHHTTAVSGGKVIVRLEFIVFGVGSGAVTFEGQNLDGGDASAILDANGDPIFMHWYAGNLVGTE